MTIKISPEEQIEIYRRETHRWKEALAKCEKELEQSKDAAHQSDLAACAADKERDQAWAACASLCARLVNVVELTCSDNENEIMLSVSARKAFIRVLAGHNEKVRGEITLQDMLPGTDDGTVLESKSENEKGDELAQKKGEGQKKVSELLSNIPQETPRKDSERCGQEGPIQGKMQMDVEECSCIGSHSKTEAMPGVRMGRVDSWSPLRLQQAVRSTVAMRDMSRQEAQKICDFIIFSHGQPLLDRLAVLEKQANAAMDKIMTLDAELRQWRRMKTDPGCTHMNLMTGTIALTRKQALHFAGVEEQMKKDCAP